VLPLKDNIPTERFPLVTIILIAINVAVFAWQLSLPDDGSSSAELRDLGVSERDEASLELGAIPQRITDPGHECAVGAVPNGRRAEARVVCEGSAAYREATELADQGAPFSPLDWIPWWATVITSMFLHGGLLHIAGNMLFLWVFGNNVEDAMGRLRFVAFYLLAGTVAVYAQSLLDSASTTPTIGASGAVAGVLGAYILLHPKARVVTLVIIIFFVTFIEIPALVLLAIWFALQFLPAVGQVASTDLGGEGIAYVAHVGGFLFGLAAIKLFTMGRRAGPVLRAG
jgi:membrane associated rhomboid family serine protease